MPADRNCCPTNVVAMILKNIIPTTPSEEEENLLLQEDGDAILLEDGQGIELEQ